MKKKEDEENEKRTIDLKTIMTKYHRERNVNQFLGGGGREGGKELFSLAGDARGLLLSLFLPPFPPPLPPFRYSFFYITKGQ
jgi:hypothetical protein